MTEIGPGPLKPDGRPARERRARLHETARQALLPDGRDWSHPHLPWRLRLNTTRDAVLEGPSTMLEMYRLERVHARQLAQHCRGATQPASNGLYLESTRDLARLIELYPHAIARIQHKSQVEAAGALADTLDAALPKPSQPS